MNKMGTVKKPKGKRDMFIPNHQGCLREAGVVRKGRGSRVLMELGPWEVGNL